MNTLQSILLVGPVLLFSVIAHEYAHGYVALLQGDPTAQRLGRLTWNPIRHIDLFLTILLPTVLWVASHGQVVLGGAKPVPVDPRNYRNYRRGDILVSLAGVAANLALAVGCAVAIVVAGMIGHAIPMLDGLLGLVQVMLTLGIWINLLLIAFNVIPIPPLDGSHVVKHLLPPAWAARYESLSRYGIIVLVVLLYFGGRFFTLWLQPAIQLTGWMMRLVGPFVLPAAQLGVPG
ncbi:MAG TPA: site-2 protease family protein [Gemmatimonadaceae bacterium]|nr:site-2 protease family protein [Gemmatimonadaceae bacterium]